MELEGTCINGNQMEENGRKRNWKEPAKMETRLKKMEENGIESNLQK